MACLSSALEDILPRVKSNDDTLTGINLSGKEATKGGNKEELLRNTFFGFATFGTTHLVVAFVARRKRY